MYKIFSLYFVIGVVVSSFLLIPQNTYAAELVFKIIPSVDLADKTTIVDVRIDSELKKINVVDGTINFKGEGAEDFSVQVENGNSVLSLWPVPPQYLEKEKVINFTGGIPDGFVGEGLLFRLKLSSAQGGDLDISYDNGSAYLNDGKGTKEIVNSNSIKVSIDKVVENEVDAVSPASTYVILILVLIAAILIAIVYVYKKVIKK
jgi:hypothetical protein